VSAGARFFDGKNNDRGWAAEVRERAPGLGGLTVLDVDGPESALADYLACLDQQLLRISATSDAGVAAYQFRWASAYRNGKSFRVRGLLERR
jgi:hypothetical protein